MMQVANARHLRIPGFLLALICFGGAAVSAQEKPPAEWTPQKPAPNARHRFRYSEGTWMALDQSPDGKWIVSICSATSTGCLPAAAKGESLTQDSGIALTCSRGTLRRKTIAFISDRKRAKQFVAHGRRRRNPRLFLPTRHNAPSAPSGLPTAITSLCSVRVRVWKAALNSTGTLVLYHKTEAPDRLVAKDKAPGWHSVSRDGKYLYFDVQVCPPLPFGTPTMLGCSQLRRMNLQTRKIEEITGGQRNSRRGTSGGAVAAGSFTRRQARAFGRRIPTAGIL